MTQSLENLRKLGIVREITGKKRGRIFIYAEYLNILIRGTEPLQAASPPLAGVTGCTTTKPILDEIDRVPAQHGLNEEALDFTINYDIKYHIGKDSDE